MIYTSSYRMVKDLDKAGIVPIAISRFYPRDMKHDKILWDLTVAPTVSILETRPDLDLYRKRYFSEILANLNADQVVFHFAKLAGYGNDFALLCYEKPDEFCHRQLVAEWLRSNGYEVKEFTT